MGIVLLILFYTLFPAVVLYLADRYTIVQKIGPVVICYAFGLIVGNIFIFGESVEKCQEPIQAISIFLAIPLLLFSLDHNSVANMPTTSLNNFNRSLSFVQSK